MICSFLQISATFGPRLSKIVGEPQFNRYRNINRSVSLTRRFISINTNLRTFLFELNFLCNISRLIWLTYWSKQLPRLEINYNVDKRGTFVRSTKNHCKFDSGFNVNYLEII